MVAPAFDGSQAGPPVGHYTYTVADDHWAWSDGMYALHGYEPGEVPATTEMMLAHKHPDDRARTFSVLESAVSDGSPFSCYHRIIDKSRRVRSVVAVGRTTRNEHGKVDTLQGFFIDLTELRRSEGEADLQAALVGVAQNRAVIDQAKGIVMLAVGCDEDDAFAVLRQRSQNSNIKVHDLAHRLVKAVGVDVRSSEETRRAVTAFFDALR